MWVLLLYAVSVRTSVYELTLVSILTLAELTVSHTEGAIFQNHTCHRDFFSLYTAVTCQPLKSIKRIVYSEITNFGAEMPVTHVSPCLVPDHPDKKGLTWMRTPCRSFVSLC